MIKFPGVVKIPQSTIDKHITTLANKIKKSKKKYSFIVGIARGGLNISKPLSKLLNIPHKTIKVSFYGKAVMRGIPQEINIRPLVARDRDETYLIVDDLVDGGNTFDWIKTNLGPYINFDSAVVYYNKRNDLGYTPTFYAKEKPKKWIVFPWE